MPLTVGEWRDLLYTRWAQSNLWAVRTPSLESAKKAIEQKATEEGVPMYVSRCPRLFLEPYAPLFSFLKDRFAESKKDLAGFLDESGVYSLHRGLFEAMYGGGVMRREMLFLEELSFEKLRLEETLFSQLRLLVPSPMVWVIEDAQYLSLKMQHFIKEFLKEGSSNLKLVLVVRKSLGSFSYFEDFWEELVQQGVAYELEGEEMPPSAEENLPPLPEIFSYGRVLLYFFHFEETLFLLDKIRSEVYLPEDEITYFFLRGMAHYYRREFQKAIEAFHSGLEKSFDINSEEHTRHFQFYLALSYLAQGDMEQAYKHIYVVYHHGYSQSMAETYGYLFYYLLISGNYQGRWNRDLEILVQQVLAEAERLGFLNMKAYILGVYFMENIQACFVVAKREILFRVCEEMIALAEKLGNEARLAAAYHNLAMVHSILGNHDEAFGYYRKSLDIKERFQNPVELAQIRNGIAYGYILAEKYEEAAGFLQQNIYAMRTLGNITEILLTLVNVGVMLVGTGQYEEAITIFITVEEMRRKTGLIHLPYHSNHELGCYLGICYAQTHQNLRLFGIYQRVKGLIETQSHSAYEDILWLLVQAYFYREEKRKEELKSILQKLILVMAEYRPSLWLLWRHICALFYEVFEEGSSERAMFSSVISRLKEQDLISSSLVSLIENLPSLSPVSIFWNREECLMVAEEVSILQSLEQNLVRMHFLRQIYSIMASTSLSTHLFQKILSIVVTYLPVSSAFFLLLEDFHWQHVASVNDTRVFDPLFVMEKIYREIKPEQRVINLVSQPYWENLVPFKANIYLVPLRRRYIWEGALILLWNESFPMSLEQEELLAMLGEYLAVQVYYKKLLDNLRFLNYDITTGFYKGEEIVQQMRRESARTERYGRKLRNFAVAYVMLENFFHFREKYGENLSNFFLKRFRQYLERSVREVDMVGYMMEGGVVILFPESRVESVEKFVKRLEAFFLDPLNELKDVQKLIPAEKTRKTMEIHCHIGVVDYHTCAEEAETLLHIAKEMALRARANGTLMEVYTLKRP
ncbi:tetratricopeptide repeat-containing diguanylate cyclase [Thermospira aquatica]|uniref:Tetratricopeptide repeat protein n=1 Tax=Thermospira aquatica TaxID=2828656 RepID=A0AAX3BE03_9SPIR|nr:tetratricopeptide repeat protein [Thermospira aquatica]URA10502.1 tetratricopeptide repeat protein [Thermospira aquatica]